MKPSFNFLDLLPFQLWGGLGIIVALLGYREGNVGLFFGLALAVPLWIAAFRSVPMR
jgi:hypothetical protein